MRSSGDFKSKLRHAEDVVRQSSIISDTDLFAILGVGFNKFYMIKRALKNNSEFLYNNGIFSIRRPDEMRNIREMPIDYWAELEPEELKREQRPV